MVASDTVVGLVGAAILVVALVGVFVIESKDTSTATDLSPSHFDITGAGAAHAAGQSGQANPVTNQCMAPLCAPPRTWVNLTLTNVPSIDAPLTYAMFLVDGSTTKFAGENARGTFAYSSTGTNEQNFKEIRVTLETTKAPSTPSNITVYSKSVSLTGGSSTDIGGSSTFALADTDGKATFTASGTTLTVSATGITNRTGFAYRAWAHQDDASGSSYTFIGNMTQGSDGAWTTSGSAPGGEYMALVTLEPTNGKTSGTNLNPAGPTVFSETVAPDDHSNVK